MTTPGNIASSAHDRTREAATPSRWIAVTGGGTGGHVYPAIAVIERMASTRSDLPNQTGIVWIGSRRGLERKIVGRHDIVFVGIATGKLRRYLSVRNFLDLFLVVAGFFEALAVLRRYRPRVLFAKGGYVSVPPVAAARILGIPTVCHESDLDPGLATRINGRFADLMLLPYEESKRYYSARRSIRVVGVPIRNDSVTADRERGRKFLGAAGDKPVLLVVGGSLGARRINELIEANLDMLCSSWYVVHQTGSAWNRETPRRDYRQLQYIGSEYCDVLAAADCVVCRAGATTLWECAVFAKAMVLLPLGLDASRGDQIRNTEYFTRRNAAVALSGSPVDGREFVMVLERLSKSPSERKLLGETARSLVHPDASERIAKLLDGYLLEE